MLVYASVDPSPSISGRVLCVGHVGAGIEAPRCARLASDAPAIAEEGPDCVGSIGITGVMLLRVMSHSDVKGNGLVHYLVDRIDEREHCPGVSINDECPVELINQLCGLLHRDVGVRLAEGRRRLQAARILSPVQTSIIERQV